MLTVYPSTHDSLQYFPSQIYRITRDGKDCANTSTLGSRAPEWNPSRSRRPGSQHTNASFRPGVIHGRSINLYYFQTLMMKIRTLHLQATSDNIKSIVQKLLSHLVPSQNELDSQSSSLPSATEALTQVATSSPSPPSTASLPNPNSDRAYRRVLSLEIISICSKLAMESYGVAVTDADFDYNWYISVLVDLAYVSPAHIGIGSAIRDQLLDVAVRVTDPGVRQRAVSLMIRLLNDENVLEMAVNDDNKSAEERKGGGEEEVLWAAAWICGEFCRCVVILSTSPCPPRPPMALHGVGNSRNHAIFPHYYWNRKMFTFFPNGPNLRIFNAPSSYSVTGQRNYHHNGMTRAGRA